MCGAQRPEPQVLFPCTNPAPHNIMESKLVQHHEIVTMEESCPPHHGGIVTMEESCSPHQGGIVTMEERCPSAMGRKAMVTGRLDVFVM